MYVAKKSFVDKVIASKGHQIQKIKAQDETGRWAYYFLLLDPLRESNLRHALSTKTGNINLQDYGRVIASCYGDEPSDEVKQLLQTKYGFFYSC